MEVRRPGPSTVVDSTILRMLILVMRHSVFQFGEFGTIPTVGCSDEVSRDALEAVDVRASAIGAVLDVSVSALVAAVHAAVAVVVYGAVAHVVFVHEVDEVHYGLRVVRGVAVNLDVEDVAASCEVVVRCFDAGFVCGTALVVYGYVVGVGVIVAVGDAA